MRFNAIFTLLASLVSSSLLAKAAALQTIQEAVYSFAQTGSHPYGHGNFQALASRHGITFDDAKNYTLFVPYNYALGDDAAQISSDLLKYHICTQSIAPASGSAQILANTMLIGNGNNSLATRLPSGVAQRLIINQTSNPNVTILSYGQDNTTSSDFVMPCANGYIYFILSALKLPLTPSQAMQNNQNVGGLNAMGNNMANTTYNGQSIATLMDNAVGITFFAVNNTEFAQLMSSENMKNPKLSNHTYLYGTQTLTTGVVAYTDYLSSHAVLVNQLGNTLNVTVSNGNYYINGVQIIYANIPTWNGVIHVVANLFDDNTTSTRNKSAPPPVVVINNDTTTTTNTTSSASSFYAGSAVAVLFASVSALFFVFSL